MKKTIKVGQLREYIDRKVTEAWHDRSVDVDSLPDPSTELNGLPGIEHDPAEYTEFLRRLSPSDFNSDRARKLLQFAFDLEEKDAHHFVREFQKNDQRINVKPPMSSEPDYMYA